MSRGALGRLLRSVNAQLLLWAILPMTLLLAALGFAGVYEHQRDMQAFVAERDSALAGAYARMVASWYTSGLVAADGHDLHPRAARLGQSSPDLLVLDADGRVLSHPDTSRIGTQLPEFPLLVEALAADRPAVLVDTEDSDALTLAPARVGGSGWILVISEPASGGMSSVLRYSSLGPVVMGVGAVITALILTFGWRTIAVPLRRLSRAAEQIDWTLDTPAITLPAGSVIEVVALHRTLSDMMARVRRYQASIRDYLSAVTEGQEAERARLALDIHDGTLQELIALAQRLEMAQRLLERGEMERAKALLSQMREASITSTDELRRIISDLRPAYLEDLGFLPALEMLVRAADERGPARVRLEHDGSLQRLPQSVELAAYRIAQEALNNALQHAQAGEITVRVGCLGQTLSLEVIDNGSGFELPASLDSLTQLGHFGLIGIRERAYQLRGTCSIESRPGGGTRISVVLPGCGCSVPEPSGAMQI